MAVTLPLVMAVIRRVIPNAELNKKYVVEIRPDGAVASFEILADDKVADTSPPISLMGLSYLVERVNGTWTPQPDQ